MPGRGVPSSVGYRYGFNGKENDPEAVGVGRGTQDYGMRIYNPSLGKFLSVDPLTATYPELTPYQFASNRPIDGIDMDGLEYVSTKDVNIESSCDNGDGTGEIVMGGQTISTFGTAQFNGQQYYQTCSNVYCSSGEITTSGTNAQLLSQMFVTSGELGQIFPSGTGLDNLANTLNSKLLDFGIRTPEALAHFLGQAGEETGGFVRSSNTENLNYSASGLTKTFGKYFSATATKGKSLASDFAHKPEEIANIVYANRMGNGDEASGEGWLYRGRGVIQLTGRNNYFAFQAFYNSKYSPALTITTDPGPVASDANTAVISALWYFQSNVASKLNLQNASVEQVTRRVNGGTNGLSGRTSYYNNAVGAIK